MHASLMVVAAMTTLAAGVVSCQDFPNRPIRITTTAAGGGGDFVSRIVSEGVAGPLGQPVIVDNRTGFIPGVIVQRATPDGYSLGVVGGSFWLAPLQGKTPYDTTKDFSYISILIVQASAIAVSPSLPVTSTKELIALAKSKPGTLNYASSSGAGGTAYLGMELFKSMAGVNLVWVPHKAAVEAYASLMNGEAHIMIVDIGPVAPLVKAGKLRLLGVASLQPSALAPGVPTVAATGLPGYEVVNYTSAVAPAKTPPAIVGRLNREMVRVLHQPEVRTRLLNAGMEPVASSPDEMVVAIKTYLERWAKVIKDVGIKTE